MMCTYGAVTVGRVIFSNAADVFLKEEINGSFEKLRILFRTTQDKAQNEYPTELKGLQKHPIMNQFIQRVANYIANVSCLFDMPISFLRKEYS